LSGTEYSARSATSRCSCVFIVFFFQAEDGIRDATVTGVQTCALPISFGMAPARHLQINQETLDRRDQIAEGPRTPWMEAEPVWRSEERRVGKECRSGG